MGKIYKYFPDGYTIGGHLIFFVPTKGALIECPLCGTIVTIERPCRHLIEVRQERNGWRVFFSTPRKSGDVYPLTAEIYDALNGVEGKDWVLVAFYEDHSQLEPGNCLNGGSYGYEERVYYIPSLDVYVRRFYTTSEFKYCRVCGSFEDPHCEEKCWDAPYPGVISDKLEDVLRPWDILCEKFNGGD